MELSNLYDNLNKLKIPLAYRVFKEEQSPPYCIYALDSAVDFKADNIHYKKIESGFIEIYSLQKDLKLENRLEEILSNINEIAYERVLEDYLSDEGVFLVRFEFEMITERKVI